MSSENSPLIPNDPNDTSSDTTCFKLYAQSGSAEACFNINAQPCEVLPAIPTSVYTKPVAVLTALAMGGGAVATLGTGVTIPPAIATAVFTLVGTTIKALKDWQNSDEPNFSTFFNQRKAEYLIFAAKLGTTGFLSFSPYVLCNALGKYYHLNPIGMGVAASALGTVAFATLNKVIKLDFPADKIIGIAAIFLGLSVADLTWEYCSGALINMIGREAYKAWTPWAPALATSALVSGVNGVTQLMKTCGWFGGERKNANAKVIGNIQEQTTTPTSTNTDSKIESTNLVLN